MAFCASCGTQLNDGIKFCSGCGTASGEPGASPAAPAAVSTTTVMAKSFRCSGCGASLEIPKNSRGNVRCPHCKNECVLDGLVKNAEMAAKNNISSGIALSATPHLLHRQIISLLSETPTIPLDIFEKAEVVREERYCVPAFEFEYDAEAPFKYQLGKRETRQEHGFKDGAKTITTITETIWYPQSSSAAVNGTLYLSGNKELAVYINKLYGSIIDSKDFIDFEYLEYPVDVKTLDFNIPETTVLNEYVKPIVDSQIQEEVTILLRNENVKDINISGIKINRNVKRVFLGLYHVVYKYNGKEYSLWANGNGKRICHEGIPVDPKRKAAIQEKEAEKAAVPRKTGLLTFGLTIGIIATILGGLAMLGGAGLDSLILLIPGLAIAILCGIKRSKIVQIYDAKCAKIQDEIDVIVAQATSVVQKFKSQRKALPGIYEKLSGDSSAF
jgi:DNA-directed RNA polymerase subunit RPC12/RpoP